jgi:PAS domain S-box-containing protein/diguanylate cyclase (GGDEF)-like protein
MTNHINSTTSLFNYLTIYSSDIKTVIDEHLYSAPTKFSVDTSGVWIFEQEKNTYTPRAYISNGVVINDELPLISEEKNPSLFDFIQATSGISVTNVATNDNLDTDFAEFLSTLNLQSILLVPLQINDSNRGFVFLGNSTHVTHWSDDALLTCQLLSRMFIQALIVYDNKCLEKELHHQNQVMIEMERMANIGGWDYEVSTDKLTWTDEVYRIYDLPADHTLSAEKAISFFKPDAQKTLRMAFNRAITHQEPYTLELPLISAKGEYKWVRATGKIRYTHQITTHVYGSFEDISERKNIRASEEYTSKYLKNLVDNIDECIITIFANGNICSANNGVEKSFGYSIHELIGQNISKLILKPFSSSHDNCKDKQLQTDITKIIGTCRELPAIKKNGTIFPVELSISEVLDENENKYICIVRNISDKKKAEFDIHKLSYYDETTGALNRYSFEKDLKNNFHKSWLSKENFSAFLINIDKFSQINLTYGENTGDDVLRLIATRLMDNLPSNTEVYRNSADTFYVLVNNNDVDEFSHVFHESLAKEILKSVNASIYLADEIINVQVSIGILYVRSEDIHYIDIKPLLELAVLDAKKQGGNCFVFAVSDEVEVLKRNSELSQAMKSHQFTHELSLVLQPQYSTDGVVVGSESLVRWQSAILGFVSPNEFIPLAEKNGNIIALGDWVIDKTCLLISQRRTFSKVSSPVSINISVKQIAQPLFCDKLLAKLEQYKIPYSELTLEITENALIADFDLVISKMKFLKHKGIHFSIDDFGTGYSSLSYIHHLPISELKIDKYFVDDIKNNVDEVPIINTIIQLAKSLNLKVVAEGVECKEQLDYLKQHKCDVIQGYYFSKPLNPEQWIDIWALENLQMTKSKTMVNPSQKEPLN